jgi:hypothetical protein
MNQIAIEANKMEAKIRGLWLERFPKGKFTA